MSAVFSLAGSGL